MASTVWSDQMDPRYGPPQINTPVQEVLTLVVGKPESGYLVAVSSERERGRIPRVYAGSTLEQCVQAIMAEFVAAKLES